MASVSELTRVADLRTKPADSGICPPANGACSRQGRQRLREPPQFRGNHRIRPGSANTNCPNGQIQARFSMEGLFQNRKSARPTAARATREVILVKVVMSLFWTVRISHAVVAAFMLPGEGKEVLL